MAKSSEKAQATENRTKPVDVGPEQSLGLAAAWDGIYHFFGGRVGSWDVTPEGLVAHDFSVDAKYDPEVILRDINRKNRRVPLYPTVLWIGGADPEAPKTPQEMTTFSVQFFKGSVEEGSSRAPKYVREAIGEYKTRTGTRIKRGPKPKAIPLKNLGQLDASALAGIKGEDLQHLMEVAQEALKSQASATVATG